MANPQDKTEVSLLDWNFIAVPDEELVACCLWEYGRESEFICGVRQRCIQNWKAGGARDEPLSADQGKLHSIGPAVEGEGDSHPIRPQPASREESSQG